MSGAVDDAQTGVANRRFEAAQVVVEFGDGLDRLDIGTPQALRAVDRVSGRRLVDRRTIGPAVRLLVATTDHAAALAGGLKGPPVPSADTEADEDEAVPLVAVPAAGDEVIAERVVVGCRGTEPASRYRERFERPADEQYDFLALRSRQDAAVAECARSALHVLFA